MNLLLTNVIVNLQTNGSYSYTINFLTNLYLSNKRCIVSIGDLQIQSINNGMDIFVEVIACNNFYNSSSSHYYSSMAFSVKTSKPNSIQKLGVSYFVYFEPSYYSYDGFIYSNNAIINSNISKNTPAYWYSPQYYSYYYTNYYYYYFVMLNGFKINSTGSSLTYSISISPYKQCNYYYCYNIIRIESYSQIPTYVQNIAFTVFFIRNSNFLYPYYKVRIYAQTHSSSNAKIIGYSDNQQIMHSFNTFVGLSSFHISNQQTFNFTSSISQNTISIVSPSTFNYLSMTSIIIYSQWCSYKAPYNAYYYDNYGYQRYICTESCPQKNDLGDFQCSCVMLKNGCIGPVWNNDFSNGYKESYLFESIITLTLFLILIYAIIKVRKQAQNKQNINQNSQIQIPQAIQKSLYMKNSRQIVQLRENINPNQKSLSIIAQTQNIIRQ